MVAHLRMPNCSLSTYSQKPKSENIQFKRHYQSLPISLYRSKHKGSHSSPKQIKLILYNINKKWLKETCQSVFAFNLLSSKSEYCVAPSSPPTFNKHTRIDKLCQNPNQSKAHKHELYINKWNGSTRWHSSFGLSSSFQCTWKISIYQLGIGNGSGQAWINSLNCA